MKILSGTSNLKLSKEISKLLKLKLVNTNIKRFSDNQVIRNSICLEYEKILSKKINTFF